jgi:K+-dependent Na+/Ca+ exchanger-like protein
VALFAALALAAEYDLIAKNAPAQADGLSAPVMEHTSLPGRALSERTFYNITFPMPCPVAGAGNESMFQPLGFSYPEEKASATVFMLVVTVFMFIGLAIVCDSFFESSLSAITETLQLKDDVAGATFMAAGGSAPELATSIIGVFISKSDVGFGTIVGSAVFNVLFVIACCAFAKPGLSLTWWPLARDASYYCFSLAMIVIFISVSTPLQVEWWEAAILFCMYIGYCTIMYFNEALEEWVTKRVNNKSQNSLQKVMVSVFDNKFFALFLYLIILVNSVTVILDIADTGTRAAENPCVCGTYAGEGQLANGVYYYINLAFNIFFIIEMFVKFYGYGFFGYWQVPLNCFDGSLVFLIVVETILTESYTPEDVLDTGNQALGISSFRMFRLLKFVRFIRMVRLVRLLRIAQAPTGAQIEPEAPKEDEKKELENGGAEAKAKEGEEKDGEGDDDDDDDEPFSPCDIPDGPIGKFFWWLGLPLSVAMWLTIVDCAKPGREKLWPITFVMCILWIAGLSFFMVWMLTRFGKLYGVSDTIMGFTLLAAGTSIPDCLSSIAVARRGHGDMAVSSSIGSNIFDVLFGLPIPWLMYTAMAAGLGESPTVPVQSEALAVLILSLFVMVALVITTIHLSGWKLTVKLGAMMMVLYFGFVVVGLMLEFGIMFPDCTETLTEVLTSWCFRNTACEGDDPLAMLR